MPKKKKKRRVASARARKVASDKTIKTKTRLKDDSFHVRSFTKIGSNRGGAEFLHHRGPPALLAPVAAVKKLLKKRKR